MDISNDKVADLAVFRKPKTGLPLDFLAHGGASHMGGCEFIRGAVKLPTAAQL
jgi:hypothetical protein